LASSPMIAVRRSSASLAIRSSFLRVAAGRGDFLVTC
jgi:hypothetical protein